MRDLLRPGGVPAVAGLARGAMPDDLPRDLAGVAAASCRATPRAEAR
ncbi:hypothetical protein [Nonomuraea jabiensis]